MNTATATNETAGFEYISMEGFSHELGKFVGLKEGETFAESETKINAVFKAYDGHATPQDIRMDSSIVEAGTGHSGWPYGRNRNGPTALSRF